MRQLLHHLVERGRAHDPPLRWPQRALRSDGGCRDEGGVRVHPRGRACGGGGSGGGRQPQRWRWALGAVHEPQARLEAWTPRSKTVCQLLSEAVRNTSDPNESVASFDDNKPARTAPSGLQDLASTLKWRPGAASMDGGDRAPRTSDVHSSVGAATHVRPHQRGEQTARREPPPLAARAVPVVRPAAQRAHALPVHGSVQAWRVSGRWFRTRGGRTREESRALTVPVSLCSVATPRCSWSAVASTS